MVLLLKFDSVDEGFLKDGSLSSLISKNRASIAKGAADQWQMRVLAYSVSRLR